MDPHWIELIKQYGVLGLILGAMVFEDVTLLMAVGFVQSGAMTFMAAFWGVFIGLNVGNWLVYGMGYAASFPSFPWQNWAERLKISARKLDRANDLMVFFTRFVPGTRVPIYALAGFTQYSLWKFFILNIISAAIWGLLILWLGESVFTALREHWMWVVAVIVVAFIVIKLALQRALQKKGGI